MYKSDHGTVHHLLQTIRTMISIKFSPEFKPTMARNIPISRNVRKVAVGRLSQIPDGRAEVRVTQVEIARGNQKHSRLPARPNYERRFPDGCGFFSSGALKIR
ncbi:hypothetical protein [Endozoicomonas acroporae]|uniref:hypothetical protein n=1 Tax=Endozoicomonas acroporae TaxID=1701104 RepID=UPI0011AF27F1|nr:hypothetical protein [Endozoicomonas acroporae]